MKMTESYIWKKLKAGIPEAHFTRHEDKVTFGIPDVSYGIAGRNGWIELKSYRLPPLTSIPSFNKFKRTQRSWLKNRGRTGSNCWVLTGFGDNILLLSWEQLDLCGKVDLRTLIKHSHFWGSIKSIKDLEKIFISTCVCR